MYATNNRSRDIVWIDYAILAVVSVAMIVYAYLRRPDGSDTDDDSDGGVPSTGGDASPTEVPPSVATPERDPQRETADV